MTQPTTGDGAINSSGNGNTNSTTVSKKTVDQSRNFTASGSAQIKDVDASGDSDASKNKRMTNAQKVGGVLLLALIFGALVYVAHREILMAIVNKLRGGG